MHRVNKAIAWGTYYWICTSSLHQATLSMISCLPILTQPYYRKKMSLFPDFNFQGGLTVFLSRDWGKESGVIQSFAAVSMTHLVTKYGTGRINFSPFNVSWKCCLGTLIPGAHTIRTCKRKKKEEGRMEGRLTSERARERERRERNKKERLIILKQKILLGWRENEF